MKKLLFGLLLILGCGPSVPPITGGKVIDKCHTDEWTSQTLVCADPIIFMPVTYPETFSIHIKNGERSQWREVTKLTYQQIKVGDEITLK